MMPPDFIDLLRAFVDADVRFLVVGAHALAIHGRPRATGDLDVWVEATADNAGKVMQALRDFGAPLENVTRADFSRPGVAYQIGLPPLRIDILTELTGLEFSRAWPSRVCQGIGELEVPFVGRDDFIRNKAATGRLRDLADIEDLG
jgi:hypothetical protein